MRIVGGEARGRRLKAPPSDRIRPTSDRIREAIFDLLGPPGEGQAYSGSVLDLFAGTGALGIEALSRGFETGVFVERDRIALGLIRENLARCGYQDRCRVEEKEVLRFLEVLDAAAPFALVLLDPPYKKQLVPGILERLVGSRWVSDGGRIVCEGERDLKLPERVEAFERVKHKRYGDTSVHLYIPG
jgi:16S rRNA (guanine(966)-N(2))-methyltransferase RsmD